MKMKFFAFITAITMIFSLMPTSISAANYSTGVNKLVNYIVKNGTLKQGSTGNHYTVTRNTTSSDYKYNYKITATYHASSGIITFDEHT